MQNVSVITSAMNREAALRVSLASWLVQPGIAEVVICDWSSTGDLRYLTEIDCRVRVVRVEGEAHFRKPPALNLAADFASHDWLLHLDLDDVLNPYQPLLQYHPPESGTFLTGYGCRKQANPLLVGLDGLLLVERAAFHAVHGFNEYLAGWGYEDTDMIHRLRHHGLVHANVDFSQHCAMHLWHDGAERVRNCEEKGDKTNTRNCERAAVGDYTARLFRWDSQWSGRSGIAWRRLARKPSRLYGCPT